MRRTTRFRQLLTSPELEPLLEAHNGISARIAEEAGFRALWAGGLCMSAQFGVRDSNEASWTQVLEALEFMVDATTIPILVDGDTGHGNFNNVRRLVGKLEQRGVAALCIEDKLFPKSNSFIDGGRQQLADIDEFCSRIKAGKDARKDGDFCIITRIEAFIAGWGLDEALRRAEAYLEAGSDGILIHSSRRDPSEVLAFQRAWAGRCPVLIVPTKYYATPTDVFREAGFSMVIYANQMLRAAIVAYQDCARTLAREQSLIAVEDRIATVQEVFRLQRAEELQEAEARYLPKDPEARALILAASRGAELGELTLHKPKAMIEIQGRPLLAHIVAAYNAAGIRDITVVRGYLPEAIDLPGLRFVDNPDYADSGELLSLARALAADAGAGADLYVSFGDVIFRRYLVESLADRDEDFLIAVDSEWRTSGNRHRAADYVTCDQPHSRKDFYRRSLLVRAAEDIEEGSIHGEWTGILRVSRAALPRFRASVARLAADPDMRQGKLHHLLTALVAGGEEVGVVYSAGHWLDIDSLEDLVAAGRFPVIEARRFVESARRLGFSFYSGVPCSYLTPLINFAIDAGGVRYVAAANEGDAVAIAAGARLGGRPSVAMFQNSGLGNAVSPLTSLTYTFRIPVLLIPTLRGEPGGRPDEPQHELMGRVTTDLLELMRVPWEYFPGEEREVDPALERAAARMDRTGLPYALVLRHGSVAPYRLRSGTRRAIPEVTTARVPRPAATRRQALEAIRAAARPEDVVVATTGHTGRELYACGDRDNQLYMVGSMGCASSLGLGLALARPERRVIVIDGDGAALMRLGALGTIGHERPPNLVHVLLDNGRHESTGGQATVSGSIHFPGLAAAAGYPRACSVASVGALRSELDHPRAELRFVHVPIRPGKVPLPRPAIPPAEVARRLERFLGASRPRLRAESRR